MSFDLAIAEGETAVSIAKERLASRLQGYDVVILIQLQVTIDQGLMNEIKQISEIKPAETLLVNRRTRMDRMVTTIAFIKT